MVTVQALMTFALLVQDGMCLQLLRVYKRLQTNVTLEWHLFAVLRLNMGFQVGGVCRLVVTVLTDIRFLSSMSAHVLLELRWMTETLSTLHTDMWKALAVHSQEVPVQ